MKPHWGKSAQSRHAQAQARPGLWAETIQGGQCAERPFTEHRIQDPEGPAREGGAGRLFRGAQGHVLHAAGPVGLRQDHDPALHRRARAPDLGRDRGEWTHGLFLAPGPLRAPQQAQFRHGVPVLRHLAAYDRLRQRRLSAGSARQQALEDADRRQGDEGAPCGGPRPSGRARRHQALRRPAAAPGARPRAGHGARAFAARRAPVQPRRQAARPHARGAEAHPARAWPHHHLCHP